MLERSATTGQQKGYIIPFMTKKTSVQAGLRNDPIQVRAKNTVAKILAAAITLLREGGPEALTTSALAKSTSLHIRNVYRYFPNRLAIFAALAERLNQRIEELLAGFDESLSTDSDWRQLISLMIDNLVALGSQEPALTQIRSAMRASPELQVLELESDKRIAAQLANALEKRGIKLDRKTLEIKVFVLVTAIGAMLDRVLLDESQDRDSVLRELKLLAQSYFENVIDVKDR